MQSEYNLPLTHPPQSVGEVTPAGTVGVNNFSPVRSYNEWDPLEEIIVGIVDGASFPSWHIALQASLPDDQHEIFRHQRFLAQMSVGSMPHRDVLRGIELFGTKIAPAVRAATADVGKKAEIIAG